MTKFMTLVTTALFSVSVQAIECSDNSTHTIEVDCQSTNPASQALRVAGILHLKNSDKHFALTKCSSLKLSDKESKAKAEIKAGSVTSGTVSSSVVAGLELKDTPMQVDFEIPDPTDAFDSMMSSTIIVGKDVIQMKCAAHKVAKKSFSLKRLAGDSASE